MTQVVPTRRPRLTGTRLTIAASVLALLAGGYLAYQAPVEASAAASAAPPPAPPVSVAAALSRTITPWSEFSGRLEAVGTVDVRSRVAGYIESVHFAPGSIVSKGDTLFVIDARPFQAEVERAQAAVAAAQARFALTGSELARAQTLLEDRAIAQREFDERRNAQREAQAAVAGAQAALDAAQLQLGYTRITAPIGGRVGRAEVTVGNLVAAGATGPVLTSIVSVSPIYASFDADERSYLDNAAAAAAGKRIPVHMGLAHENGHPRQGVIESVDNRLDPRTGTVRMRAVFDNRDGSLAPGLYARVRIGAASEREAVLVSDRAIGTDQHKRFVWVVADDGKVAWREVKLGPVVDGLRVVQEGLAAGEKVVVNGLQRVRPGSTVAPTLVEMDGLAAAATTAARS